MKETHILEIDKVRVKVIIQTPKKYQNRIVKYGWVLMLNRLEEWKGEKFHKIAKRRYGDNRFGYSCDCEDNFYRGRLCRHISAFRLGEGTNAKP